MEYFFDGIQGMDMMGDRKEFLVYGTYVFEFYLSKVIGDVYVF